MSQLDLWGPSETTPTEPPGPPHGLRPYQEEAVKGVMRELEGNRSTLVVMPTGCHAPGQKVLRLDGALVAVENVRIGDLLMGPDSKPREVLCLHHGIGEMVAICPTKGSPWTVNRGHILTLVRTNDARKPGLVCDVSVDEWSRWSRTHKHVHKLFRTGVDFPQAKPLPVDPYFLGLWLGDGQKRLDSLCIFNKDPEVFAYLESFAESNGLVYRRSADGDKCPRLSIVGKRWHENPVLYAIRGILGDGFKIRVPTPVLSASKRDRLQALAGLMDSDGSLSGGGFDFISIERELADGVSFLARSVGLAAYVSKTKKTCQTGAVGDYWRVSISGDCAMVPTKIARKKADTRQQKKDVLRTGFSAEVKEDGEYFGFQLSGDGRYLLDDFTVTHNSGKTRVMTEVAQRRKTDKILVLAHRDELLQQAVDRFGRDCGEKIGLDKAEDFAGDQRIVVGSVQTVSMPSRLERFDPGRFDLVMVDECFPAGTMIATPTGNLPIEAIRESDRVLAWDEKAGKLIHGTVARTMRRQPSALVSISHEHGILVCTPNHPVLTPNGWKAAGELDGGCMVAYTMPHEQSALRRLRGIHGIQATREPGESVPDVQAGQTKDSAGSTGVDGTMRGVREADEASREARVRCPQPRSGLLLEGMRARGNDSKQFCDDGTHEPQVCIGTHDGAEPNEPGRRASESIHDSANNAVVSAGSPREWTRPERTAGASCCDAGVVDGSGNSNQESAGRGVSDVLQAGHCQRDPEGRDRSGRQLSPGGSAERAGREEGLVSLWSRVDRVEIQEPSSDGRFEGLCRDGLVYNFEVAEHHTYVANGVIVHNCHHAPSPSYRRVVDYFGSAKVLGVTATPDRADEKAMGQVFDSVAFLYEIEDAINDGYLCDVRCSRIEIAGLDLSNVKTVAGDLNQGELDAVMAVEEVLLGVADATIREAGKRRTLLFTTSVANADKLAEILNRHRDGCAMAVNGKTELDRRRGILKAHQAGDYQFLVNCALTTEGYDDPAIACVAMARPTKSRAFYTQCVGRGLRILDGKLDCLILDFCGNSGRHKLASALDVLGGRYTEEEEEIAQELVKKNPGMKARDAIDQAHAQAEREKARAEEAAKRAAIKAHAIYSKQTVDPFGVFHLNVDREQELAERFGGKIASQKQLDFLEKRRIPIPGGCTSQLASKLISTAIIRQNKHLATFPQLKTLQKYGINEINISFSRAGELIDAIAKNGWKPLSFQKLDAILQREREPGEDG